MLLITWDEGRVNRGLPLVSTENSNCQPLRHDVRSAQKPPIPKSLELVNRGVESDGYGPCRQILAYIDGGTAQIRDSVFL